MVRPLLALVLAAQLLPATALVVHLDPPPSPRAGQTTTDTGYLYIQGPAGQMPGTMEEVEVSVQAPWQAGCQVSPTTVELTPTRAESPVHLACTPARPGTFPVTVTAEAWPHANGTWEHELTVAPDLLEGQLDPGGLDGFHAPLNLTIAPVHLERAPVNVTFTTELLDTPLGFTGPTVAWNASAGSTLEHAWTARHGPGTYEITARATGPWTETFETATEITVPEASPNGTVVVDLTLVPGQPSVALADDDINADGKHKRPGEVLTTRVSVENATHVNVSVLRAADPEPVLLDEARVQVPSDGLVEHTFQASPLPTGTLVVVAQAGESKVQRTASIQEAATTAEVHAPGSVLGDGRPVVLDVTVADENFGSTPLDPGPVFGLPSLSWRTFSGSMDVDGWASEVGPFQGTGRGEAATDRLAWPDGASWANVTDGQATLELVLEPPPLVEAGSYRVSVYEAGGDRLAGASFELLPRPTVDLAPGTPVPGQGLVTNLTLEHPVPGTAVNVTLSQGDTVLDQATATGNATLDLDVPGPLAAGTELTLVANATWPGRPPGQGPDAVATLTVPDLAPLLSVATSLDGRVLQAPLGLHPAGAHVVQVAATAEDPNGQPVTVEARALDPAGELTPWQPTLGEVIELQVPADQAPGRYHLEVLADDGEHATVQPVPLDIAPVTRVSVEGPDHLELAAGGQSSLVLNVTNTGTTTFPSLLVAADLPDGVTGTVTHGTTTAQIGQPLPGPVAPGTEAQLTITLEAQDPEPGTAQVELTVAGVVP